jgi:hypothetical protein
MEDSDEAPFISEEFTVGAVTFRTVLDGGGLEIFVVIPNGDLVCGNAVLTWQRLEDARRRVLPFPPGSAA